MSTHIYDLEKSNFEGLYNITHCDINRNRKVQEKKEILYENMRILIYNVFEEDGTLFEIRNKTNYNRLTLKFPFFSNFFEFICKNKTRKIEFTNEDWNVVFYHAHGKGYMYATKSPEL